MSFNKYSVYSAISSAEEKNDDEFKKILKIVEKLYTFKDSAKVHSYLKEELNLENGRCYRDGCFITVTDDKTCLLVNLTFGNENYKLYYNK